MTKDSYRDGPLTCHLHPCSQAKCLTSLVNRTLKLSEEEALHAITWRTQDAESKLESEQQKIIAKGEKLIEITTAINKQLTMLLAIVQENDRERETLKLELTRSQDQVDPKDILHFYTVSNKFN